ncbi:oxidoreductase [Carboxylicivirga sp. RSCT41]|uniref:oxidoreductase n=1 Tax=Carboxylicivirga agarovorans TaxID=3417570 RepID=UPI003D32FF35
MKKVILVTGASAGIGKATAKHLIGEGHIVYGAARRVENMQDLEESGGHAIKMDVTNSDEIKAGLERIMVENGRIDVLVNNAGYSVYGAVEDVSMQDARRQFDVNIFGLAELTQLVLPYMRKQQSGHIINITSIGGKIYFPLGAWYHATKHALEGWSDCLRLETKDFGIKVSIIEPGAIQTEFGDVMNQPMLDRSKGGAYEKIAHAIIEANKGAYDGSPSTSPDIIAKTISKAISAKNPKTRYAAGKMAKPILFARRWLSDKAFDNFAMTQIRKLAK